MNQIIAFVDPLKFGRLLGAAANDLKYKQGMYCLDNGNFCFYVKPTGACLAKEFDLEEAKDTLYILVPDYYPVEDMVFPYEPAVSFKLLWHSKTEPEMYKLLLNSSFCEGYENPHEETGTTYGILSTAIIALAASKKAPKPDPVWAAIPNNSYRKDLGLRFLGQLSDELVTNVQSDFNNLHHDITDFLNLEPEIHEYVKHIENDPGFDLDGLRHVIRQRCGLV